MQQKHDRLVDSLRTLVEMYQDKGFRFSDLLEALAEYVEEESYKIPEESLIWQEVKSHLLSASDIAETQGLELP